VLWQDLAANPTDCVAWVNRMRISRSFGAIIFYDKGDK